MTALALTGSDAPFVGREREQAVLVRCVVAARHGEPGVAFMEGRAGAGKSTLLTRFLRGLPDSRVIRASGAESELPMRYGLIGQLLASGELGAREAPPASVDQLIAGADLATLLGQAIGAGGLVVLAIDDLHWADPASSAELLFALRRLHGGGFLGALAADLEAAGRQAACSAAGPGAASRSRLTRAATWLAHASALSPRPAVSARLILDAVENLLSCGAAAEAEAFAPRADAAATGRGEARSAATSICWRPGWPARKPCSLTPGRFMIRHSNRSPAPRLPPACSPAALSPGR